MSEVPPKSDADTELAQHASAAQRGVVGELVAFLAENKKWWLAPIIIVMLLLGVLIFLAGTSAAPFIYTLF